jgi:hypothetical protein
VSDVARVSTLAIKQLTVQHDSATNAGGHHHRHEVVNAFGSAKPTFCKSECFCITVTEHGQPSVLL